MITRPRSSPRNPELVPSERGLLHTSSSSQPLPHSILSTSEEEALESEIPSDMASPCLSSDEKTSPDVSLASENVGARKTYLSLFKSGRHHRP